MEHVQYVVCTVILCVCVSICVSLSLCLYCCECMSLCVYTSILHIHLSYCSLALVNYYIIVAFIFCLYYIVSLLLKSPFPAVFHTQQDHKDQERVMEGITTLLMKQHLIEH